MALLQKNAVALCLAVIVCSNLGLASPISQHASSFPSHLNPLSVSLTNYQSPQRPPNVYTLNPRPVVYSPTPIYKPNEVFESKPNIVIYEPQFRQDPKPKIVTYKPQIIHDTKPTYEPPRHFFHTPKQTYEPPVQTYVSPLITTYEPVIQTYESPIQPHETLIQTYEPPQQNYEPPKQSYEPPQRNYEPPKPTYEPKPLYEPQPQPQPQIPIYRPEPEYHQPIRSYRPDVEIYTEDAKPYSFDYGVRDSYHGTNFGHSQKSDGKEVKGSYTVALPDGRIQKVTYTADHYNGYQAVVTYEGEAKFPEFIPQQKFEPVQQHIHSPPIYQPNPRYSNANAVPSYNVFPSPVYSQF